MYKPTPRMADLLCSAAVSRFKLGTKIVTLFEERWEQMASDLSKCYSRSKDCIRDLTRSTLLPSETNALVASLFEFTKRKIPSFSQQSLCDPSPTSMGFKSCTVLRLQMPHLDRLVFGAGYNAFAIACQDQAQHSLHVALVNGLTFASFQ